MTKISFKIEIKKIFTINGMPPERLAIGEKYDFVSNPFMQLTQQQYDIIRSSGDIVNIIGRSNFGLLLKAIEYVTEERKLKSLYLEGNISSHTFADDGASLYGVLNLYNGSHHRIRNKPIGSMKILKELEDFLQIAKG